jgi:hypothetical protein
MSNNRRKEFATQAILCSNVLIANNLPRMDSNHDKVIQSHLCYRYTTRQKGGEFAYHIVGKSQMTNGVPASAFVVLFSFSVPPSATISS